MKLKVPQNHEESCVGLNSVTNRAQQRKEKRKKHTIFLHMCVEIQDLEIRTLKTATTPPPRFDLAMLANGRIDG